MNKYYIKYTDKSGDLSTVWINATSKEDAIFRAKHEYWDIENILTVMKHETNRTIF